MRPQSVFAPGLLTLLSLLSAGCINTGPSLGQVEGAVTFDGTPLAHTIITFTPTAPGGTTSTAVTDTQGHYRLMFTRTQEGALLGRHRVSFEKGESAEKGGKRGKKRAAGDEEDRADSTARIVEVVSGPNTLDFALTSDE